MADSNKVKYGLKNVHYAKITPTTTGSVLYATPVAIPGAVNLSLAPDGNAEVVYANGCEYIASAESNGYTGSIEMARFPDAFMADIFGSVTGQDGLIVEDAAAEPARFALLFEFAGDAKHTRHVLYNCVCTRPELNSSTSTAGVDPATESCTLNAMPLPLDANDMAIVKGKCASDDAAYETFFDDVVTFTPIS